MATGVMNQAANACDLRWTQNDPLSFSFVVKGEDWSGTYQAQARHLETGALLVTFTVVANYVGGDTYFTMTNFQTRTDPVGVAAWALKMVGGSTKLSGKAHIVKGVVS